MIIFCLNVTVKRYTYFKVSRKDEWNLRDFFSSSLRLFPVVSSIGQPKSKSFVCRVCWYFSYITYMVLQALHNAFKIFIHIFTFIHIFIFTLWGLGLVCAWHLVFRATTETPYYGYSPTAFSRIG